MGIKQDGTLWSWGSNNNGGLGQGSTGSKRTPLQIGNATNWVAVSAGFLHSLAMKADGSVYAWGANSYGELGIGNKQDQLVPVQVK